LAAQIFTSNRPEFEAYLFGAPFDKAAERESPLSLLSLRKLPYLLRCASYPAALHSITGTFQFLFDPLRKDKLGTSIHAVGGKYGCPILHFCSEPGVVDLCLKYGADPSAKDRRGFDAIDCLTRRGQPVKALPRLVELLTPQEFVHRINSTIIARYPSTEFFFDTLLLERIGQLVPPEQWYPLIRLAFEIKMRMTLTKRELAYRMNIADEKSDSPLCRQAPQFILRAITDPLDPSQLPTFDSPSNYYRLPLGM